MNPAEPDPVFASAQIDCPDARFREQLPGADGADQVGEQGVAASSPNAMNSGWRSVCIRPTVYWNGGE